MNEKKFKEKLIELLMELSKPKKFEVGFVQGNRIVNDGLVILGMTATDVLGFAKPANERRIRKVKGAQAWFKKMYDAGWRYKGTFEQEGLLHNGFAVMERELPNKNLDAIREGFQILLRDDSIVVTPDALMTFIPDKGIKNLEERKEITKESLKRMGYKEDEISVYNTSKIPKAVKEPRDGFESDVEDFMLGAKKEMKTDEQLFFEETGKKAIWRSMETIAFKEWKKGLD